MKDVEKLTGKRKERKKKKKKLRKKALKFLKEHKGKAYTKEELKEKMDLGEELSDLMDDTPLTSSSSLWYFWFGGPTIESEPEGLETYYYYEFDWPPFISGSIMVFCVCMAIFFLVRLLVT